MSNTVMDHQPANIPVAQYAFTPVRTDFPPPPRLLRRTAHSAAMLVISTTAIALVFLLAMVVALASEVGAKWFGRPVEGTVVEHRSAGNGPLTLKYSYVLEGKSATGSESVTDDTFNRYGYNGQRVPLLAGTFFGIPFSHINDAPNSNRVALIMLVVVLIAWPSAVAWALARDRRNRWLLTNGAITTGRITNRERLNTKPGTESRDRFTCTYDPPAPLDAPQWQKHESHALRVLRNRIPKRQYSHLPVGQPVAIFYDPRHPRRGVVYEFCEFEIVDDASSPR